MGTEIKRYSIGRQNAAALYASQWWHARDYRKRARFQAFVKELTMPFDVFIAAVDCTLLRPVRLAELVFDMESLCRELIGEQPPPTFEDIVNLLPADKRPIAVH